MQIVHSVADLIKEDVNCSYLKRFVKPSGELNLHCLN